MNYWKVILATMVIFGAGVVTGGLLVRYSEGMGVRHETSSATAGRPTQPASAGGMRLEFLRRLEHDLSLTAEQRERSDAVLKESQERIKKLMEPVSPKIRDEVQRTKEEFRELLAPGQRLRFDELLKKQQKQQQRSREQRQPPPLFEQPADDGPPE